MNKRISVMYCGLIFLSMMLIFRVYYISASDYLKKTANQQSCYTLDISKTRNMIYDCNLSPLVNEKTQYIAAIAPCPDATLAIANNVTGKDRTTILEMMQTNTPFATPVPTKHIYSRGIYVFDVPQRYSDNQLAPHIIGHLNGTNEYGVNGIEKAFNDILSSTDTTSISYVTNAKDGMLENFTPTINRSKSNSNQGVVLTIDKDIQQATQDAMSSIEKGSAVVMDVNTGEIKACVSTPLYNPNKLQEYLDDENGPLLNRALSSYSVGSTFKLIIALSALEQNVPPSYTYFCNGGIDVLDTHFNCHYKNGHCYTDLKRAIEWSCNPYFINLGLNINIEHAVNLAKNIGFGKETILAPNFVSSSGHLTTMKELQNPADIANFSFGQGTLMATPIQITQMICTIANGGYSVVPKLVKGITNDGESLYKEFKSYAKNSVVSEKTAKIVRDCMVSAVENGGGSEAKPNIYKAGGKTASAQTGQFVDGEEIVHAWFAGFYPAEKPQYAITILSEGGIIGGEISAPVFKKIADSIQTLHKIG